MLSSQVKVQVVNHLFMPMSPHYRKELCQRHFKCALRFYFEEFLEEKLEVCILGTWDCIFE